MPEPTNSFSFLNFNTNTRRNNFLVAKNPDFWAYYNPFSTPSENNETSSVKQTYTPFYTNFNLSSQKSDFPKPENNGLNYLNQTFTKDMQVDYKNGNPVVNSIFRQFDKNANGKFEDDEWTTFSDYVEKNNKRQEKIKNSSINNNVVDYYEKKLQKYAKQFEQHNQKYSQLDSSVFDELIQFESKHENLYRSACKDKKDIPKGAKTFDATNFEIGVYDEEKKSFTGETCKYGYIIGLDTLTKDEREQYLKLLKNCNNLFKKYNQLKNEYTEITKQYDKYYALKDLAEAGEIDVVGSEEYENQMYEKYINIRTASNPFYKQIKDLEKQRNELWLKSPRTEDDERQIEQYNIQIEQLEEASRQWSIRDTNESFNENNDNKVKITGNHAEPERTDTGVRDTRTLNVSTNNENMSVEFSATNTNTFSTGNDPKSETNLGAELKIQYNRDNLTVGSTTSVTMTGVHSSSENRNTPLSLSEIGQNVNLKYENFQFNGQSTFTDQAVNWNTSAAYNNKSFTTELTAKGAASYENGLTYQNYQLTGSYSYGKGTVGGGISTDGKTFGTNLSATGNYTVKAGDNTTFTFNPSTTAEYNTGGKTFTLAPNGTIGLNIRSNDVTYSAQMQNQASLTFAPELTSPNLNNTFTFTGNVNYNHWTWGAQYTTTNFTGQPSTHTVGTSAGYQGQQGSVNLNLTASVPQEGTPEYGVSLTGNWNIPTTTKKQPKSLPETAP